MLLQDQQKNVDPRKHLSCQNHLPQPSRSFHCYWNTNCWRIWGYEVSSSILWVKFLGSHTRTRKSIQSPNWKKCRWNSQSRAHTVQNNTQNRTRGHALIHKANQQVPHCVPHCTHRYSFPPEWGQTVNAGAMWGCVPTPTLQLSSFLWPSIHTHTLQLALLLPVGLIPGPNTTTASSTLRDWSIMYFVSLLAVMQTCPWLTHLKCIHLKTVTSRAALKKWAPLIPVIFVGIRYPYAVCLLLQPKYTDWINRSEW